MNTEWIEEVPINVMLDSIFPYLLSYHIIAKGTTPNDVNNEHLLALSSRWKVGALKSKSNSIASASQSDVFDMSLLQGLYAQTEVLDSRRAGRRGGGGTSNMLTATDAHTLGGVGYDSFSPIVTKTHKLKELERNYFGLPPYALHRTAGGIIYQARKPYEGITGRYDESETMQIEDEEEEEKSMVEKTEVKTQNHSAQRKVASALMSMASTASMLEHFVYKGGVDAVSKLAYESTDPEVLASCASSIGIAATQKKHALHLIKKQVISLITCLIENGDELTKYLAGVAAARLTCHENMDVILVQNGIIMPLQSLLSSTRLDTVSYAMLSIANASLDMMGNDAETSVRYCLQGCKRLDFIHEFESAYFLSQLFNNLTRLNHFVSLICDEGVLPVLISLLENQPYAEVVEGCSEAFFNLSMLRKNRRDIYGSGVAAQMVKMLQVGSAKARAYCLLMVGNLLGNGLFQDKIAREDILKIVISLLDPKFPEQCLAASYVISHLSHFETPCEIMLYKCDIIPNILSRLGGKSGGIQMKPHCVSYLWTALANMSHDKEFFLKMMQEENLPKYLAEEASNGENQEIVAQLLLNMSNHEELLPLCGPEAFGKLVLSIKTLFIRGNNIDVKRTAMNIMINLCICIRESRAMVLAADLIDIIEESSLEELNTEFLTLVYLISNEPTLCPKLVDFGAQRLFMSIVSSIKTEYGRDLIAATLHNMSLKRALLGTGVLPSLMQFARNCMSIRVLWVARTLANMSSFPRSRSILAKEKKIIPCLAGIMRYGCLEAERVQHYCALAICNVVGTHLEKSIVLSLIKNGTITDLVVVTLLRVNAVDTKESLAKALFNLLSRADVREQLVNLDVFEALVELSRIDKTGLLELSVKTVYNMSCETESYAKKFLQLKITSNMITRTLPTADLQGTRPTNDVKLICGKAIANMSFNKDIALQMTFEKVAESCAAIAALKSDEARYCACATLFNISFLENTVVLANTVAVPMLVAVLASGPIKCTQLAVAALTNFSMHEVFHDQLTTLALGSMIKAISQPSLDANIKQDCVYFIYNLVTKFGPAHMKAVEEGCIAAMGKMVKFNDSEEMVGLIGRIIKECCSVESMSRKILSEGVMAIIAKLAKLEFPMLKLDLACAVLSLTVPAETTLKMLKLDTIDVLFWITLHDCLGLYDQIRNYVVRAIRNFTLTLEDAVFMVKEDRFISIIKTLLKSGNEDVLWHTAVVLYNLLNPPTAIKNLETDQYVGGKKMEMMVNDLRATLLKRQIIQLIFDVAATGTDSVRHLCSACLHSVADHIPNSDDPAVLQLIMCLLDAEGDQFTQLANRVTNDLLYNGAYLINETAYRHDSTDFTGNWQPEPCAVDVIFSPAAIEMTVVGSDQFPTSPLDSKVITLETATLLDPDEFRGFKGHCRPKRTKSKKQNQKDDGTFELAVKSTKWKGSGEHDDQHPVYFSDTESEGKSNGDEDDYVMDNEFSDDEDSNAMANVLSVPSITSPRPPTDDVSVLSETSADQNNPKRLLKSQSSSLPRIVSSKVSSADRSILPNDTIKALHGTQYNPKSQKNTVSIKGSFDNSSSRMMPPI